MSCFETSQLRSDYMVINYIFFTTTKQLGTSEAIASELFYRSFSLLLYLVRSLTVAIHSHI